jgi:hypothetical protein
MHMYSCVYTAKLVTQNLFELTVHIPHKDVAVESNAHNLSVIRAELDRADAARVTLAFS